MRGVTGVKMAVTMSRWLMRWRQLTGVGTWARSLSGEDVGLNRLFCHPVLNGCFNA